MISLTTSKTQTTNSNVITTNETPADLPTGRVPQIFPGGQPSGALKPGCHHDDMFIIINGTLSVGVLRIRSFDIADETFTIPVDESNSITYKFVTGEVESGTVDEDGFVQVKLVTFEEGTTETSGALVTDEIIKAVNSTAGNNEGTPNKHLSLLDSDSENSYEYGDELTVTFIHNTINENDSLPLISSEDTKLATEGFTGSADKLRAQVKSWVGDQLTIDKNINIPAGTSIFKEWIYHHGTKAEFLRKKLLGLI